VKSVEAVDAFVAVERWCGSMVSSLRCGVHRDEPTIKGAEVSSGDETTNTHAQVWLVTGASSGLGRSIALAALAAGDTVVAASRRTDALCGLVAGHPDRCVPVPLDVTDRHRIREVVTDVVRSHGAIDVLVNAAGWALVGAVEETTERELRDLMEVHFFGPAELTRAVLPHMRSQGSGAIVQISSVGGRLAFAGVAAYAATKFALEGLSEGLAAEVRPLGIKVLIVEPGAFRTGLHRAGTMVQTKAIAAYDDTVGPVRAAHANFDGTQPGDPAKAAAAILAALDDESTPLRLPLGNDAGDLISAQLDHRRTEFRSWEPVTRATDLDT
jgi:NAD(P)-dependent dehydrogenase (short-subunit alcohol dehydrogenase family)